MTQVMQSTIVNPMTAVEARECADKIKVGIFNIGKLLLALYEGDGWRALGYSSWRECAQIEFGFKQSRVYQLLEYAEIERNISDVSTTVETNNIEYSIPERVLRPLAKLAPTEQREVYQRAVETAPNGKVTAAHVQAVKESYWTPDPVDDEVCDLAEDDDTDPIVDEYESLGSVVEQRSFVSGLEAARKHVATESPRLGVHFSSDSPEHYTPKKIVDASIVLMGEIDLDPCSNSKESPNVPALDHYTIDDDGLDQPWFGRVYMNPPYGRGIGEWVTKLVAEYEAGNVTEAIALVPARTDTQWWQTMRNHPACFVTGRLTFIGNEDAAPFPSAIFYLGERMEEFCKVFGVFGDIWSRVDENWFTE